MLLCVAVIPLSVFLSSPSQVSASEIVSPMSINSLQVQPRTTYNYFFTNCPQGNWPAVRMNYTGNRLYISANAHKSETGIASQVIVRVNQITGERGTLVLPTNGVTYSKEFEIIPNLRVDIYFDTQGTDNCTSRVGFASSSYQK